MDKVGRLLTFLGLITIIVLGIWIYRLSREALPSRPLADPRDLLPQPTPTIYPSAATVIEGVQALQRLETASYHIEKVITAESGQGPLGFLFGDKLLLIAYGEVIAGVDLSQMGPSDLMTTEDGTAYVRLPAAEVFVATLDNRRTYVYDRRTGVAGMNPELETAARQEAERLILQAALEDGVLDKAEQNAREFLRSFVLSLGFEHVIFVSEIPTPTLAPPLTPTPTSVVTVTTP